MTQQFVNIKLIGVDVAQLPTLLDVTQGIYETFTVEPYQQAVTGTALPPRPLPKPAPSRPDRRNDDNFVSSDMIVEMVKDNTLARQLLLRPEGVTLQVLGRKTGANYDAVYRASQTLLQEGKIVKTEAKGPRGAHIYRLAPISTNNSAA